MRWVKRVLYGVLTVGVLLSGLIWWAMSRPLPDADFYTPGCKLDQVACAVWSEFRHFVIVGMSPWRLSCQAGEFAEPHRTHALGTRSSMRLAGPIPSACPQPPCSIPVVARASSAT